MDAKELRIGNYILDYEAEPEVSIYWKVEEIQRLSNDKALNQTIGVTYRKGSCWTCDPEPIPLTEEWLVKFGFELEDEKIYYHLDSYEDIYITKTSYSFSIYNATHFTNIKQGIKHVHQLQNLYFALTNEELTIK